MKMIVGSKGESAEEMIQRHINIARTDLECWKSEYEYALKKDYEYIKHCENMILIWRQTLQQLEKELESIKKL